MWAERGQSTHQIDSPAPRPTSSALMKCNRDHRRSSGSRDTWGCHPHTDPNVLCYSW